MKKFVIIGATLSGNKGTAAMALSLVRNLTLAYPNSKFTLASYQPFEDRKINHYNEIEIVNGTPIALACLVPVLLFAFILKKLNLPLILVGSHPIIKATRECDLFFDASGVSFIDGREKILPFNIMCVLAPLVLGKPTIKAPQALGPFQNPVNRFFANKILPKIQLIAARGEKTSEFLKELNLVNYKQYPDITFISPLDDQTPSVISKNTPSKNGKHLVGVCPSQVVYKKCFKSGIDYIAIFANICNSLISKGYMIHLLAHSIRFNERKKHNNDVPIINQISSRIQDHDSLFVTKDDLTPSELRTLIGQLDIFIVCRFHALISALSVETPSLTLGWSHKYHEILKEFELEDTILDYSQFNEDLVLKKFYELEINSQAIREKIKKHLPRIKGDAHEFIKHSCRFIKE